MTDGQEDAGHSGESVSRRALLKGTTALIATSALVAGAATAVRFANRHRDAPRG